MTGWGRKSFALLALALGSGDGTDHVPEYALGDISRLTARVESAEEVVKDGAGVLLQVEVQNRGELFAEPLVFRFETKAGRGAIAPLELARFAHPHHGRAGRGVAPGGTRVYPLLVPLAAKFAERCEVVIARASFSKSAFELEEPLAIGRLVRAKEFREERQATVEVTRVVLGNRTRWPLDVALRADFHEPHRASSLVCYRLAAGEEREVALDELPLGGGASFSGAKVVALALADVCAIVDDGAEVAAALFREAYGAWVALPPDTPALGACYELAQTLGDAAHSASGELVLRSDGSFELGPDDANDDTAVAAVRSAVREALAFVRRPSADEVLAATRIELAEWGETSVVHLATAPFQKGQRDLHLWIERGRIAGESLSPRRMDRTWTLRDEGAGYVVIGNVLPVDWQRAPQYSTRLDYARVGELVLPATYRDETVLESHPASSTRTHLSLTGWTVGVDPDALGSGAPPEGELAELLRAAWELPYRYPGNPAVLRGRFELTSPANDALWRGHRKVAGTFELRGFRGTRWSAWRVNVEGDELGDDERRQLGEVIEDRLRLFAGRDFGGRAPFERAFRRARLERDGAAIAVRGAGVERVELAEGRPVRLVLSGGARREITWRRIGGAWLPAKVATDGEELRYEWSALEGGWFWPKEVLMRDVFPDWGPERIRFSRLELERE